MNHAYRQSLRVLGSYTAVSALSTLGKKINPSESSVQFKRMYFVSFLGCQWLGTKDCRTRAVPSVIFSAKEELRFCGQQDSTVPSGGREKEAELVRSAFEYRPVRVSRSQSVLCKQRI